MRGEQSPPHPLPWLRARLINSTCTWSRHASRNDLSSWQQQKRYTAPEGTLLSSSEYLQPNICTHNMLFMYVNISKWLEGLRRPRGRTRWCVTVSKHCTRCWNVCSNSVNLNCEPVFCQMIWAKMSTNCHYSLFWATGTQYTLFRPVFSWSSLILITSSML
jgi:hypothetical protein